MRAVTTHDRTGLVAILPGALVLIVAVPIANARWGAVGVLTIVTLAIAATAAVLDARSGRIPDSLVLMAGLPVLAALSAAAVDGHGGQAAIGVALGGIAFAGPLFVMHVVSPEALGFGDVKLAAALGAMLGTVDPRLGLLALCFAAGSAAVTGLIGRRASVPFGPGLVLGATTALAVAALLGEAVSWQGAMG